MIYTTQGCLHPTGCFMLGKYDTPDPVPFVRKRKKADSRKQGDSLASLGRRVASKLEDGDFKGAVRLACSDDRMAPHDSATLSALQDKHPSPRLDSDIPPPPAPLDNPVEVEPSSVAAPFALSRVDLLGDLTACDLNTSRIFCLQPVMKILPFCRPWRPLVRW